MEEALSIVITPNGLITAAAVVTAVVTLAGRVFKARDWVISKNKQDEIAEAKVADLSKRHDHDMKVVNKELHILVEGTLACLKGLQEQGCNGPVTKGIEKLEDDLNDKAHK